MSARPEADPQIGRTLGGQYRIEALLGAGGMGRVYRGRQLSVNRAVAIKVIAGQPPHPPEWVRRFRREAEATASLSHPNSVRLFDFGVTESEELFMVMELLEGTDLARQLQARGPLPLVAALAIARQVLLALCEAHALGITHRDIKPDNIFLANVRGAEVVAKVMDFGIAGIAQAQRKSRLTGAGMIIGTPMYMSPEQAQGLRVDGKSDVYSLGVVLFEMLTGRPIFESHTAVTLLLAHVARAPTRLDEAGVQLREQASLQALLDRLLAKAPNDRPSAAEALETVTALATRLGIAGATGTMRALTPTPVQRPTPSAYKPANRTAQPPSAAHHIPDAALPAPAPSNAERNPADDSARDPREARRPRRVTPPSPGSAVRGPGGEMVDSRARRRGGSRGARAEVLPPLAAGELAAGLGDSLSGDDGGALGVVDVGDADFAALQSAGAASDAPLLAARGSRSGGALAGEMALARGERTFQSARALTGARWRPGLAMLGAAVVLSAASALAFRWGPSLFEAAQPLAAAGSYLATPEPERAQRTVLINSQPNGAQVLVDGKQVGTTPFQMKLQADTEISVARDGYTRRLVNVPYDAHGPMLVKLAALPDDKQDAPAPFYSLRQENHPRIGPRADTDHERRDHGTEPARTPQPTRNTHPDNKQPSHGIGVDLQPSARADIDRERHDDARGESARADERRDDARAEPPSQLDTSRGVSGRADIDRARRDDHRAESQIGADRGESARADRRRDDARGEPSSQIGADRGQSARADVDGERASGSFGRFDTSPEEDRAESSAVGDNLDRGVRVAGDGPYGEGSDVGRGAGIAEPGRAGDTRHQEALADQDVHGAGLDVARVLEMGREPGASRERAAQIASEHARSDQPPSAAETSHSAATRIDAIREDEVEDIALDDDERAHVAQHYGLRAIGRAVARAFGRLLIPYPSRERRAALANMPLKYSSFREARAAYKQRALDATGFQEAVWQLRERRRQKIWTARDRYARGELTQSQYQARVDRIWDEFWGPR